MDDIALFVVMRPNLCADANAFRLVKSAIFRVRGMIRCVELLLLTWLNRLSWLPAAVDFFASLQNRPSMSSITLVSQLPRIEPTLTILDFVGIQ